MSWKVDIQGHYYEINPGQQDPDKFNENMKKVDHSSDMKQSNEIDRQPFNFKQAFSSLAQIKHELYKLPYFITNSTFHESTLVSTIHQELKYQCDIVKDLINGAIIGDNNSLSKEQQYSYMDALSEVYKLLTEIELSDQYKQALENEQFKDRVQLKDLNSQLELLSHIIQTDKDQSAPGLQLQFKDAEQLKEKIRYQKLEKKIQKLEELIGLNLLKPGGKGEEEIFSLKEVSLLSTDNPMNASTIQIKRTTEQSYISSHQIVYQHEPMPITQHIILMRETLNFISGDDKIANNINKMMNNLRQENQDEDNPCEKALELANSYEHQLQVGKEIDAIANRLYSLKEIHENSTRLPNVLQETQTMIQYMDQALNQELEILVLLDKQMDENVKDLNQNLETLKKSL